jgi:hypothetical protein
VNKLLEIGIQKKLKQTKLSWQEIAEQHSEGKFANGELLRLWVKNELKKRGQLKSKVENSSIISDDIEKVKASFTETFEIKSDGSHRSTKLLELSNQELKDPNFILTSHGYDPKTWELFSSSSKQWHVYSKIDKIQTLYASSITARPRKDELSIEFAKDVFLEMSQNYQSPVHIPVSYSYDGKMLELNIADLHLGKLCWSGDSNDTYNHEIARERFFYTINDVLTRTKHYKFNKILFVWSNDFFHHETTNVSTTAGTRQDTDLRWQQLYKMGTQMLVEAIDLMSQFAPVETFYIGSNHDETSSYYATEHLAAWYRSNPNVTVDTDPKIRKYVEFGECLIQFSHGHSEGKRIGELMPSEAREAWGRCQFTEVHAGHFHSERTTTKDNGTIVRYLGSPTGTDNWHYKSGYSTSVKKSESFVWDKEFGLQDIIFTTIRK